MLRDCLCMLIDTQPYMKVVGKAKDSPSAVALLRETKPDLIIMNLSLPSTRGISAIKQLRQECPDIRILILSEYDDPVFIRSALAAGGSGYITKQASVFDFRTAIHTIYQGRPIVDPALAGTLQDSLMDQHSETQQGLLPTLRKHVTAPATILIVEDDAGVRETLVEILRPQGYLVHTAATAAEAEAALRQLGAEGIQLIITDIQLTPDARACDGYTLYQRWTAIYPRLPFLLMSGNSLHKDLPAVQDRAVQWLTKPFSPTALLDTIQAALAS